MTYHRISSPSLSEPLLMTEQSVLLLGPVTSVTSPGFVTNTTYKEENKKFLSKGALKEFEGVRISIPKTNIDMERIVKHCPMSKCSELKPMIDEPHAATSTDVNTPMEKIDQNCLEIDKIKLKSKIIKKPSDKLAHKKSFLKSFGNKLGLKVTKRSPLKKAPKRDLIKKSFDIYDFEETRDNIDVFNTSASSVPVYHPPKDRTQLADKPLKKLNLNKNITKKKCKIMERIFKNALKPKLGDEIKNIPTIHNEELVQNYVRNCQKQKIYINKQHKLTEEEMNTLFDKLLDDNRTDSNYDAISERSADSKFSRAFKSKKRRANFEDSSDEEFNIKIPPKNKKGNTTDCINMEQELKECIGVASRKSQRSCTSGKQNVLTEYWSSDDSNLPEPTPLSVSQKVVDERPRKVQSQAPATSREPCSATRQKRTTADTLYYWPSSSDDEEGQGIIEVKSLREDDYVEEEEDRPLQHGWIVGNSPKKLVTMLAQAKGKKLNDSDCVKNGKRKGLVYELNQIQVCATYK